jgi:hypothetical protein
MTAQIIFALGLLSGLAIGAVLWYGRRALADRARDGECHPDAAACALATNAVSPAVDRYNAGRPDRDPVFLSLSLRHAIGRDVAAALASAAPDCSTEATR